MAMDETALGTALCEEICTAYAPGQEIPQDAKDYYIMLAKVFIEYVKENMDVLPGTMTAGSVALSGIGKVE
jgi:hypothetical protein